MTGRRRTATCREASDCRRSVASRSPSPSRSRAASARAGGAEPQTRLVARSVLPAATFRAGLAAFRGVPLRRPSARPPPPTACRGPAGGPTSPRSRCRASRAWCPADARDLVGARRQRLRLARRTRPTSSSSLYRLDPRWGDPAGPAVVETVVLRDPDRRIPVDDRLRPGARERGCPTSRSTSLPAAPAACGGDPSARILTGFDLDPESFVRAPDGTFWVSEEFGPFLVHVARRRPAARAAGPGPGRALAAEPVPRPRATARAPERPNLAASRGFEGLAISPDGAKLYALLEGAVAGDDPQDLRIYVYRRREARLRGRGFLRLRLEMPSQTVNLASLTDASGARVYPDRGRRRRPARSRSAS